MKHLIAVGGGVAALGLSVLMWTSVGAQEDVPTVTTHDLGNGIYALYGQGGNVAISVGSNGVLMIDDQYERMVEPLARAIAEITGEEVAPPYLINTHWHGDHTGGNLAFAESGTFVMAHENVTARMIEGLDDPRRGRPVPPSPDAALPRLSFSEGATFYWNNENVRLIHTPNAHTDGDLIVYFEDANVLHMGDVFFNGMYPFIDVFSGGSLDGTIAGLERGLALTNDETRVIPGHGPLATPEDMGAAHDMLVRVRELMQPVVDEGLSLEEAVERDPLAELNETYGGGFINGDMMTSLAYYSMVGLD